MTSSEPARERLLTPTDAAAYIAWLRREPGFRSCVHHIREALSRAEHERSGEQLLESVTRVSSVIPPSARGLWTLLLDEGLDLVVGPGASLEREEWDGLVAAVSARMLRERPASGSDGADDALLERTLSKIDPAAPVLMPSTWITLPAAPAREAAA